MPTYRCPSCQKEIGLSDINVAADVALCRSCGQSTRFSLISGVGDVDLALTSELPKGITVTPSILGGTEIRYRRIWKIVFILIPFTAVWSGFSLYGIYGKQIERGHFDAGQFLFGLPFLLGSIFLVGTILFGLFGVWRITLNGGEGHVFAGIGPLGWTRRFAYSRTSVVSLEYTNTSNNNKPQKAISIRTDGKMFQFGVPIDQNAKGYLAAVIARECQTR